MKTKIKRPVIVTTEYRGVFYGYADDTSGDTIDLYDARMAIYWGTNRGLFQLAETGPTSESKISAKSDKIELRKITSVIEVSTNAVEVWDAIK